MSQSTPNLRSIFGEALDREPRERAAYLDGACGGNATLRSSVEALLAAHDAAGGFLPPHDSPGEATEAARVREAPGALIGSYKLLEQIGEGGFGVVFMAEQERPMRRKVALKVIKPGMDTRQVIARFEAERQALALMDHPHIARVLDAGATESGRPYFVMELVRGVPITHYCDEHQLTLRERLALFVDVCQAVQHAHQKGIIHRDLKPSNVLVASHDGKPMVKVIDFGVAKATGHRLTDKTLFTGFAQMIGTPLYMSPEQAELSGLDIDTRSDIYSLGVLLYELLTGATPFDSRRLKQAAFDEVRRIIREEEPPKPSTRVSELGKSGSIGGKVQTAQEHSATKAKDGASRLDSIAAQRGTEPRRLGQLLRGDLDWIVMKAMEKDRTRRYETANGLARDLQRYLADEAVEACSPSPAYRLRKLVRRNKVALSTVGLVAVLLVVGATVSTWLAIKAIHAENVANVRLLAERKARQDADNARRDERSARLEADANLLEANQAIKQMLTQVGEERLAYLPHMEEVRGRLFADALQLYEKLLQKKHVHPSIRLEAALASLRLANLVRALGKNDDAYHHCRRAVEQLEQLAAEFPTDQTYQDALADAY
jgi:serine/threonine protein kinase